MPIYNKEEAKRIMDKALGYSKADGCEINISGGTSGNIRYARNTVSTAGARSTPVSYTHLTLPTIYSV